MSPDSPEFQNWKPDPEAEKEARITALLLGELSPEESAQLQSEIEKDPALGALHQKLSRLLPWVQEAFTSPLGSNEATDSPSPWKLSEEKRNRLLDSIQSTPPPTNPVRRAALRPRFTMTRDLLAMAALLLGIGLVSTVIFFKPQSSQQLTLVGLQLHTEQPELRGETTAEKSVGRKQKPNDFAANGIAAGVGGREQSPASAPILQTSEGLPELQSKRYLNRAENLLKPVEEPSPPPTPSNGRSKAEADQGLKETELGFGSKYQFRWSKTNRANQGNFSELNDATELDSKELRRQLSLIQDPGIGQHVLAPRGPTNPSLYWTYSTKAGLPGAQQKDVSLSIESLSADAPASALSRRDKGPEPLPERLVAEFPLSTFSLHVTDVSFQLARGSLARNEMPTPDSIRSEEFVNAFDYHDPEPAPSQPIAFHWERARAPFGNRREIVRFSLKTGALGRAKGSPLNCVVLLDNSGSMQRSDRVQIRQQALKELISQLQPQDHISLVTFARTARLWIDGIPGHQASQLLEKVASLTPDGGTNIEEALKLAYATALNHLLSPGINRVILLTDGAANLGDANPASLEVMVEQFRKQGVALDCFGVGWDGYNDTLLERLSRHGDGRYAFLQSPEEVTRSFSAQLTGALQVAASDVKVQVEWNTNRVTRYRQIGYEQHQLAAESFRDAAVDAAEIGAAEAGNALYLIEVADSTVDQSPSKAPLGKVRVRFKKPGTEDFQEYEWNLEDQVPAPAIADAAPTLRLASTAAWFAEWLGGIPGAEQISLTQLLQLLQGVPQHWPADPRPKQLEQMIQQTKSITGR